MPQPLRIQPGQEAPTPGQVAAITPDTRFRASLRVLVAMGGGLLAMGCGGAVWVTQMSFRMDAVERAVRDAADAETKHHEETQREIRALRDRLPVPSPWTGLPRVTNGAQP